MAPPATMSLLLLLLSLLSSSSLSHPFNYSLHVDCGGRVNFTDAFGTTWLSDRFYSGGAAAAVSDPLRSQHQQEKTLRYFPVSSGKKNCYSVPTGIAGGRYFLRTFSVYDNYDGGSRSPSFDVSVGGTQVFSWRSPWPESISRSGAYADLFVYNDEPVVDLCLYSIATDSPIIASLELTQIDAKAYNFTDATNSSGYILVNYGRFSSGSDQWGPGFTNDTDLFGRSWQSGARFQLQSVPIANGATANAVSTNKTISNADVSPNYFPEKLYQTAIMVTGNGGGMLEYAFPADARLDYLLWFHFAEIDARVTKAGQRVFDVSVNGENVRRVDVFKEVGGFAAYDFGYVVKNLSRPSLDVRLESVVGTPFICGLENYAIIPAGLKTVPDQVVAMTALKESLRVPDGMGWNGDPCAPTGWEAWEGVTCDPTKDGSALVVSQIHLANQGLKGYIGEQIGLLSNLVSLNLSSNSLGGGIPSGLGTKSLVKLDLSKNKLTGYIPDSLTSSSLQLVLLNDNVLEGQVPKELYSVGIRGGTIDLSDNKGLCGVPSLPDCSLLWGKHGLSTGGKAAISISCLLIFCALLLGIYWCIIRRRRHDYDFSVPHQALYAKKNKYYRQKALMALEMERQHPNGHVPSYNVG